MVFVSKRVFCEFVESQLKHRLKNRYRWFIDQLRITVSGGEGGNGLPRYGGIGGKGGDVIVESRSKIENLKSILNRHPSKRVKASAGECSKRFRLLGKPGEDIVIECPVGVTVTTDDGSVLSELNNDRDRVIVALGGRGGDSCNQFMAQKGQRRTIILDLKLLADVGLIGFPNAGKSTLLKALSRASPKIASYPFTTIHPNLGIMEFKDFRKISVADLPGLIEGAHVNVGLGHKFLKHILRTKLLLFVIDINGFQYRPDVPLRTAFDTLILLNKELELYDETLVDKPALLTVSKMDSEQSDIKYHEFLEKLKKISEGNFESISEEMRPKKLINFDDIIPICAHNTYNIGKLRHRLRELIDFHFEEERNKANEPHSFKSIIDREQNSKIDPAIALL